MQAIPKATQVQTLKLNTLSLLAVVVVAVLLMELAAELAD
jgi:hypothetical protein